MKTLIIAAVLAATSPALAQQVQPPPMTPGPMMPKNQPGTPAADRPAMPMGNGGTMPMGSGGTMPMGSGGTIPMGNGGMMPMMNNTADPYGPAEMDMHRKMMMATTGEPSELWTRKMIEHHRGAIEMSRVALTIATNPQTRRMAQKTITDQGREITQMQAWLRSRGKAAQ